MIYYSVYYSFTTTSLFYYYYYYYSIIINNINVLRVGEVVRAKKRHKDRWVYARLCAIARQIDEWALPVV